MQNNAWIIFNAFLLLANGQFLLSGGMCGGGFVTRVHPAYNLQECEFNCDKDGRFYSRPNNARSFSYGSFIRGRGDCLCSTQCTCQDTRRNNYEVSLAGNSRLAYCDDGTIQGMYLNSCHYYTDETHTDSMWVQYECNAHTGGVTQIFYKYQTHCRDQQHIKRSYDFPMNECFEHFPGERIKVSYCNGKTLRFTYCAEPTISPTAKPTITTTTTMATTTTTAAPTTTASRTWPPAPQTWPPVPESTASTTHTIPTYPTIYTTKSTNPPKSNHPPYTPQETFAPNIPIMPYSYPSSAPTSNASGLIGEERGEGDKGTAVGVLGIPFVIAIFIWVICLFWLLYYCVCHGRNDHKEGGSLEGILLEEEDSAEWQSYHVHDKDHWQSAIREYPSLDIHDMTESVEGSIPYSTGQVSHQSHRSHNSSQSNRSHNSSLHDAYLIKTLPITPQTATAKPMLHHGGPIPITPQSANRSIQQRDHFWKRDPSVSISDIDHHGHSFGLVYDKFRSKSRDLTKQQGWNVGRRESMHEMIAEKAAARKSSRASAMTPAEHRYTQEFDNHSSEQMTDDSFGDGRSTHHSRSHTPYDANLHGEGNTNGPRYTTRYSLRALDPRDHKYNDVSNVTVMSIQLSDYLKERRLERFIPDLESFGVARTCDLMELHRSDINSFNLQPTKEERQKLENLFLLGAIE